MLTVLLYIFAFIGVFFTALLFVNIIKELFRLFNSESYINESRPIKESIVVTLKKEQNNAD